ncbi:MULTISPECIES: carbohydrate ABC transporter permease [Thioclava]|uniref:Transporter n=1 Tax=Thioclava nitratireducens TaxID=1915078 RepID=A0ABM6IIH7_9RHOB|nr:MULTISPECIES: sugar ABC transporter permease [Thioclava]AQS48606.1 transporter [Thioclava nitratireducens]OWY15069.1 transporter [Thioclava sp. F34-6]OWY18788.1 transporter [Thioclava sp. JM3]WGT49782.1 sugar ABC transporter permease [Thioclava nitratireducens]
MTDISPPKGRGALARREARLAWGLLFPTIAIVALVVIVPLLAIFWISVKPVTLGDLRPAEIRTRVALRERGDQPLLELRVINPSGEQEMTKAGLNVTLPEGVTLTGDLPQGCAMDGQDLSCDFGTLEPGANERFRVDAQVTGDTRAAERAMRDAEVTATGHVSNVLTNSTFTLENFRRLFSGSEFWSVLGITLFYTVFGTLGALVVGLFAALLLNKSFRGQGILRGLYLFPYVAPVIAVAFTWITLFDPYSGSANALLVQMGVSEGAINFFGAKPLALIMVTVFEIWRYFPLSFLFILARMQSIDTDMYEAADMDGASPFQKFWYLSMPQLLGILSVLFLLRFIWTFNKFDDIFLLTGGNAGTRVLTVNVYEQAFAVSNIGAGAAVAVVIFACLLVFSGLFFRTMSREEGL